MAEKKVIITGNLEFFIDEQEVAAKIIFTPIKKGGDEWDADMIYKMIASREITKTVSKKSVEAAVSRWAKRKKEKYELIVAEGVPPEFSTHETIKWKDYPLPGNLENKGEEFINKAAPPKVFKNVKEKVKIEKVVKQKTLLPFLKGKEEKVNKWETVEKQVRGDIDPEVTRIGYVQAGALVGEIIPGKIGKPGKDIYDKPIPPERIQKVDFYIGNGIIKNKNEIKATMQGFLRCGENWADVLPYKIHTVKIYASKNGNSCFLDFQPGIKSSDFPDMEGIFRDIESMGFSGEEVPSEEELRTLLKTSIETGKPIGRKLLNTSRDAVVEIDIPADKSRAALTLIKAGGEGKPLSLSDISTQLTRMNLRLNKEKLKADIVTFYKGPARELRDYILMEGVPAKRGTDGSIEYLCEFLDDKESDEVLRSLQNSRKKLKSEENLPVNDVQKIAHVEKDQKIAEITPPLFGEPGLDIFGKEIPPIRGNDPYIREFENIKISKNDIISTATGIFEMAEKDDSHFIRVRAMEDAQITVELSETKIKAFITIHPPRGTGKSVGVKEINNELENSGVIKGIKTENLASMVWKVENGETVKNVLIAEGRNPVNGSGRRLVFHAKNAAGDLLELRNETNSGEDVAGLLVEKGSVIAEILPPSVRTKKGMTVTGEVIEAKEGVDLSIETGENIEVTEEKGTIRYIARANGEVFYDGKSIELREQDVVKGDVGPATGNLNTAGSVKIEGSVLAGFKVFAKGNILVGMDVNEAVLSSDGTITVTNKIIGKSKTVLRAKKDIVVNYAENSILLAVGDVRIFDKCYNCVVKTNNKVCHIGKNSILAGGTIKAKKGLELIHLGTSKGTKTILSFGQDYLISDQIEIEVREIKKMTTRIKAYDSQMKKMEQMAQKDKEKLYKLRKAKRMGLKIIEKRNYRLFTLREKFEEHFPSEIVIKGILFPGVQIESHGRVYETKEQKQNLTIFFNTSNGKLEEKPN